MRYYAVLFAIEALFALGLLGYRWQDAVKKEATRAQLAQVTRIPPTPTPTPFPNRYENTEFGIAFRHPDGWTFNKTDPEELTVCPEPPDYCLTIHATDKGFREYYRQIRPLLEPSNPETTVFVSPFSQVGQTGQVMMRGIHGMVAGSTEGYTAHGVWSNYFYLFGHPRNIVIHDTFNDSRSPMSTSGILESFEFLPPANPIPTPREGWMTYIGESGYSSGNGATEFSIEYPADWTKAGHTLYPYGQGEDEGLNPRLILGAGGHGGGPESWEKRTYPAGIATYAKAVSVFDGVQTAFGYATFNSAGGSYIFEFFQIPVDRVTEFESQLDTMLSTFRIRGWQPVLNDPADLEDPFPVD